jgi:hypothetical protein
LGIELLERAAEARGRVLRVELLPLAGSEPESARGAGFLLTFDIGRVLVVADPSRRRLVLRHVQSPAELESIRLVPLDEEEPWWRVAGNPLTRIWPGNAGEGAASAEGDLQEVRLQFREDDERPKVISLRYADGVVRVAEEKTDVG